MWILLIGVALGYTIAALMNASSDKIYTQEEYDNKRGNE